MDLTDELFKTSQEIALRLFIASSELTANKNILIPQFTQDEMHTKFDETTTDPMQVQLKGISCAFEEPCSKCFRGFCQ